MKRTGKTLTLSGQMPKRLFGSPIERDPHVILEYANVLDISKAWRVKDFSCWIQQSALVMGITEQTQVGIDVQLSTDDIPNFPDWNNAGENRAISWGTLSYFFGDGQYKPQALAVQPSRLLMNSEYWVLPDHVVQNKLTLGAGCAGASTLENSNGYILNYIVNLEELDITPTESIIYQIKSKAQDV
ncbi:unnamed protein product [marine sediment metagenome]|uniref:Uncharacterized protein n=1 Tax=marine sediment metagenome TaxID=412755 RepID=X1J6R9_9ZZZZ